jgi:hypothetical protein
MSVTKQAEKNAIEKNSPVSENKIISLKVEDNILLGTYLVGKVDLEVAQDATAFRKQVCGGQVYPGLVDISLVKEVTKEARKYFSSQEAGEGMSALAVVIDNPVSKMMANFFLRFNRPSYPFRFFSNYQEAKTWLKSLS